MRTTFLLSPALLLWCLVGASHPAFATHNLLANGEFSTGIDGWSLVGGPGVGSSWDSSTGNPAPGSLRLTVDGSISQGVYAEAVTDECFELVPGELYRLQAQVLVARQGSLVSCVPFIVRYDEAGCMGQRLFPGNLPPSQEGVWESSVSGSESTTALSARAGLLISAQSPYEGSATCNFDSVVFARGGAASVLEVPVLSAGSLALLALLLALGGTLVLRGSLL